MVFMVIDMFLLLLGITTKLAECVRLCSNRIVQLFYMQFFIQENIHFVSGRYDFQNWINAKNIRKIYLFV